jgi:hypothetical protein
VNSDLKIGNSSRLRLVAIAAGGFGLIITPLLMAAVQVDADWYLMVGRMHFPAYIGAMAGMLYFRRRLGAKPVFWGRLGFWLAFAALFLGLVGDVGLFWSDNSNFAIEALTTIQAFFFTVDLIGAGFAQVALIYYGLGLVWSDIVRDRFGWWLVALAVVGLPLSFLHVPAGTIFATTAFWVAAAIWDWPSERPQGGQPASIDGPSL